MRRRGYRFHRNFRTVSLAALFAGIMNIAGCIVAPPQSVYPPMKNGSKPLTLKVGSRPLWASSRGSAIPSPKAGLRVRLTAFQGAQTTKAKLPRARCSVAWAMSRS